MQDRDRRVCVNIYVWVEGEGSEDGGTQFSASWKTVSIPFAPCSVPLYSPYPPPSGSRPIFLPFLLFSSVPFPFLPDLPPPVPPPQK